MIGFYQQGYMRIFSTFTTKLTAFAVIILTSVAVYAQDYARTLNWLPTPKTINTIDGKIHKQPTFTGAGHSDTKNLLAYYGEYIPLTVKGNISAQLVNARYETATGIDNETAKYIGNEPEVSAELAVVRKKPGAQIEIVPFRKSGAGIERLVSFTLRLTVTPVPERRSTNDYAANSVLASGTWHKVGIPNDGVYKLDYNFIKSLMGIEPTSINVNRLGVFSNGGGMVPDKNSDARYDDIAENPSLFVDANNNGSFDTDDYLLFYAGGPDAWKFNTTSQLFNHQKNLFSDRSYCYITTDAGSGKRIQTAGSAGVANKTITEFDDYAFNEKEEENVLKSGRIWLGDKMTTFSKTKSFTFNFPNLITSTPVKIISSVAAKTLYGSSTTVSVNGQTLITHTIGGIGTGPYPAGAIPATVAQTLTSSSSQINVDYAFNPGNDPSGTAACYIDWLELHCKRALRMEGGAMAFRSIAAIGTGSISEFRLSNAGNSTQVWDITDVSNIQRMPGSYNGSELVFTTATDNMRQFMAVNVSSGFATPEYVTKVTNQNLHGIGQPDMVIVTYDDFEAPSNDLADFHRSKNGITVSVIKLSQLYEEFACGKPDNAAIRDFMRMLYERAGTDTSKLPQYLLLMGDGSYDPKNRIAGNKNFVPAYESYDSYNVTISFVSDDYYALLDPNEGGDINNASQKLDLSIGRIPIETPQEAWDVVAKIKNYKYPSTSGPQCTQVSTNNSWRNMITMVADDLDDGGTIFTTYSDKLSDTARSRFPSYNYDKIYLDAYKQLSTSAGARYPDVNTAILNRVNNGSLIINWVGHGGETNWAHERIFNMADITQLTNKDRLPLFITATCEFSRYDLPDRTAGEWLVVNGKGGAIGALTTVRLVYQSENERINSAVFEYILRKYKGRNPTLGELMMEAKNSISNSAGDNLRKFTLLGDPAMALNYPMYDVVTTQVNDEPITMPHDTLKALSKVTIKGEVRDDNNNLMSGFNGVVYPVVYDKISKLRTLGNDGNGATINFELYKNLLFKGKASVTNGQFSFTFIVPKDIDYQYGKGRVSYYADNGNFVDAHGFTSDIIIGGAADSFNADATGPKMNIYMNDEKFVFGGTTNEQPMLLVKMEDESGINTAGNGIGHDLVAILDNNQQTAIVLNDYYESELDDYQRGNVKYPFSKLKEGTHTLKVKSWDIHNNSSEDYTEFVVASNAKLALSHVYNYPNPFTTRTQFMFEHNRPCDNMDVTIQIYTVSGRIVKSIHEQVTCEGFRVNDIVWDGRDEYGDAIGKGVYVYKLNVRDSEGNSAHKFEKLVVLR